MATQQQTNVIVESITCIAPHYAPLHFIILPVTALLNPSTRPLFSSPFISQQQREILVELPPPGIKIAKMFARYRAETQGSISTGEDTPGETTSDDASIEEDNRPKIS
jgi:hypothetical protein